MLTLAALHVMNDSSDPFFTSLAAGQFQARKPSGTPCDGAFPCSHSGQLSKGAKIAIGVVISIVGLAILGLAGWWFLRSRRSRY